MKLIRLFHTIKYLRFKQVFYRLKYRFSKVSAALYSGMQARDWQWSGQNVAKQSIISANEVCFLNTAGRLDSAADWNTPTQSKLWLYNLHYFDDLNSTDYEKRRSLHFDLIHRWISENPAAIGNGWEPYTISLRIVNWVKWLSKTEVRQGLIFDSIMQQADALTQRIEHHILGNHLFANGKALIFAGCFMKGERAQEFLNEGLSIIDEEIEEQFLDDGAHFELSPMYHVILIWDILDLIRLALDSNNPDLTVRLESWKGTARRGLQWLKAMIHNDNEVSFFNDSSMGIAASPEQVFEYAGQLGLYADTLEGNLLTLSDSGYSRITFEEYLLLFDHGRVGPDYLPGHAHADSLSFELSLGKDRVLVNSGTSIYGVSKERLRQRQTPAHNTVSVSKADSSEVWSGFRVARRAYGKLQKVQNQSDSVLVRASHDGYKRLSPAVIHTRQLECSEGNIIITDETKSGVQSIFHLHFAPDLAFQTISERVLKVIVNDNSALILSFSEPFKLNDSTWHPEFGTSVTNKKVEVEFLSGHLTTEIQIVKEKF